MESISDDGTIIVRLTPSEIAFGVAQILGQDFATASESETLTIRREDGSSITVGKVAAAQPRVVWPPIHMTLDTVRSLLDALAVGGLSYGAAPDEYKRMIVRVLILWYTGRAIVFIADSE
jgi:hypothetical protein